MEVTKERCNEIDLKIRKIGELINEKRIGIDAGSREVEKLRQELRSCDNYYEYDDFERYKKSFIEASKAACRKNQKFAFTILNRINHEKAHGDVDNRYGLPTTYCFYYNKNKTAFDTFVYVKEGFILTKDFGDYKELKYVIEKLTAPKEMSSSDKENLLYLKEKRVCEPSTSLSEEERKELLGILNEALKNYYEKE